MAQKKREEAAVSFHYLVREKRVEGKAPKVVPFTLDEFEEFSAVLVAQPDVDLSNKQTCDRIKIAVNAPVEKCEEVDERTVFGRFRALYTGHAYENTDAGEIPDSSVSLRPFFFLLICQRRAAYTLEVSISARSEDMANLKKLCDCFYRTAIGFFHFRFGMIQHLIMVQSLKKFA